MNNKSRYVVLSLELHMFFARIMKEHSLFLKAGFTPVNSSFSNRAEFFKQEFEKLLCQAVRLGNGIISKDVCCSGELITEFTACAEKQTEHLTGIKINKDITRMQSRLCCDDFGMIDNSLCRMVKQLNQTALKLLDGLIELKEETLNHVLCCHMFTMNYPLLIEHIIREAKLYRSYVCNFENGMDFDCRNMKQTQKFWNQIMMEHALFMRGLLDPTENDLINTSDSFAKDYARLLAKAKEADERTMETCDSLEETIKFRDFKMAGAKGIKDCSIRSLILPLLADHVLREANHYIRLLKE